MSTVEQTLVRERAGETDPNSAWTDDRLQDKINEALGDLNLAAALVWEAKAAASAHLTNMSEEGSSRSLGSIYSNYMSMATKYRGYATGTTDGTPVVTKRPARTRPIRRP